MQQGLAVCRLLEVRAGTNLGRHSCLLGLQLEPQRGQLQSVGFDFASFVEAIVQGDLNDDSIPLLKGRAFWFISKCVCDPATVD
jgi:hypothetical protein